MRLSDLFDNNEPAFSINRDTPVVQAFYNWFNNTDAVRNDQGHEVVRCKLYQETETSPLYLRLIQTGGDSYGQGHAKAVMQKICQLADQHGLPIELVATSRYARSADWLQDWYARLGFEHTGYENTDGVGMRREPRGRANLTEASSLESWASGYEGDNQDPNGPPPGGGAARYNWRQEPDYPVSMLYHIMSKKPHDWHNWWHDEIAMFIEDDPDDPRAQTYKDLLKQRIKEPIICVEVDGKAYLWDGYHRTAATIVSGRHTIPAIVGTPK